MNWFNVEIKARCSDIDRMEKLLHEFKADFKGEDHQIDTYFNTSQGRLKLREGNIENALIHYDRGNQSQPKVSDICYYIPEVIEDLKMVLTTSLGVKVIVDKRRQIFFIENVKFHLDKVKSLGTFIEIEAIDKEGITGEEKLREQCYYFMAMFGVMKEHLIAESYSDMMINIKI